MSGMLKNLLLGMQARQPGGVKLSPRIGSEGTGLLSTVNPGQSRVTGGTTIAPWNGPLINNGVGVQPQPFKRKTLMGGP